MRTRKKDWNRLAKKNLAQDHAMRQNKQKVLNYYIRLVGKYAFIVEKLIFSHFFAN